MFLVSSPVFLLAQLRTPLDSHFLNPVGLCYRTFVALGFIINSKLKDLHLDPGLSRLRHNTSFLSELASAFRKHL